MQQVGRVLRTLRGEGDSEQLDASGHPVKRDALILDHAGNCTRHGLPADFEVPELSDEMHVEIASLRRKVDRLATCVQCCLVLPEGADFCPACGADRPLRRSTVEYLDGDLLALHQEREAERVETKRVQLVPPTIEQKRDFYLGYRFYCRAHGRNEGSAFYAYLDKFGEKPPWSWRDLDPIPPSPEVLRYVQHRNIRYAKGRQRANQRGPKQRCETHSKNLPRKFRQSKSSDTGQG